MGRKEIPETYIFNHINKLLVLFADLAPQRRDCLVDSLINQCKSLAIGGYLCDYEYVVHLCEDLGFLRVEKGKAWLLEGGEKFLSFNPRQYFEVTKPQIEYLAKEVILGNKIWRERFKAFFKYFIPNVEAERLELSIENDFVLPGFYEYVHFFKYLEVVTEEENCLLISPRYVESIYSLIIDPLAITEEQLEKNLQKNKELGRKAEDAILEFERKRLKELGRSIQAMLVRRVSGFNVAAGYDIESFDGTDDAVFPNRFIEVKATTGLQMQFYWTNNEIRIAKQETDRYYIYLLTGFGVGNSQCSPVIIRDPWSTMLSLRDYFSVESQTIFVREAVPIVLSECNLNTIRWFQLNDLVK